MFGQRSSAPTNPRVAMSTITPGNENTDALQPAHSGRQPVTAGTGAGNAQRSIRAALGVSRSERRPSVNVRWYQRVRAAILLALIIVGIGMAVGALLGAVAMALSFVMS